VTDYHKRILLYEQGFQKGRTAGKYPREYSNLVKLRSDIKKRIKKYNEGSLLFAEIPQWGISSLDSKSKAMGTPWLPQYKMLNTERGLSDYPNQLKKNIEIQKTIEDENMEIVREIFNEDIVTRLINIMFFDKYSSELDENHEKYRVKISKILIERSIRELGKYLDPQYSPFLVEDLEKAIEICNAIGNDRKKVRTLVPSVPSKPIRLPN